MAIVALWRGSAECCRWLRQRGGGGSGDGVLVATAMVVDLVSVVSQCDGSLYGSGGCGDGGAVGLEEAIMIVSHSFGCAGKVVSEVMVKRWPTTLVLLITPPPIDEEGRLQYPYVENPLGLPERTNEAAGAYAGACVAVAGECGIPVVDLWTKMQQFPNWEKAYLRDGLHLTQIGNKIVFEEVVTSLREKGLSLEILPVDLPLISEIDPNDPLKDFQK
ncbi:hypothetical protein L1049_021502 [Liquidambar formosana]|uniref:Uncharacterized protein n=1 Tax=Liquidambar formosana TaxID=63359 RepID=A0AAP0R2I2_LIQFO